ncbi:MAG: TnpV protein [Clostridiales bacterium]|nr:TnpV protein [Clostridiales bacterium]MDY4172534.1 TnpV protein [Evtepia sp.]
MDKYIYDESNGLWYELQGEYYLPCLTLPPEEEMIIGIWGQRHLRYLKEYHRITYTNLLTSGRLNAYLAEVDEQAKDMFLRLAKEYADRQGVTEQLKVDKPLEWVQKMNNIRNAVEEVINEELVYASG